MRALRALHVPVTISTIRFVLNVCRRHTTTATTAALAVVLPPASAALPALAVKRLVDSVQNGRAGDAWFGLIVVVGAMMLALLLDGLTGLSVARAAGRMRHAAYEVAFQQALALPVHLHAQRLSGTTASQIAQVSSATSDLFGTAVGQMLRIVVAALSATLVAAAAGWPTALVMALWIAVLFGLSVALARKAGHLAADLASATALTAGHAADVFANIASVAINDRRRP